MKNTIVLTNGHYSDRLIMFTVKVTSLDHYL